MIHSHRGRRHHRYHYRLATAIKATAAPTVEHVHVHPQQSTSFFIVPLFPMENVTVFTPMLLLAVVHTATSARGFLPLSLVQHERYFHFFYFALFLFFFFVCFF